MRSIRKLLCASVAAMPLVLVAPGLAAAAEAAGAGSNVIEELIITAQKRSENLQDIPLAVTAVTGEELRARGVTNPTDLQFLVPSMQAGKLVGTTFITIRGVGLNLAGASPGVAVHVDGVYQPRPTMGDLAQIDIERVEVLRGPQGTLYGRNANGGVVNYISQAPTEQLEGYVLGSYAQFDETRLQGMINVPLNERVRARLVVDDWSRGEGFIKNVLPGGEDADRGRTLSSRLRISADLTDTLTLDLIGVGLKGSGPTSFFTLHNPPTPLAVARNPYLAGAIVPLEPRRFSANDPIGSNRAYGFGAAIFNWTIGDATLRSTTAYQRLADRYIRDDDAINVSAFPEHNWARARTLTQEVTLGGAVGPVDAVVGVFYMRDSAYTKTHYDFPLGIFPLPPRSLLDFETYSYLTKSYAVFADATWHLTEKASLLAGLRYSEDKQRVTQRNLLGFGPTPPLSTCPLQTHEANFHATTPRVGAQYQMSEDSNLYVTYSKGFKIGGFNLAACNQRYQPERLTSYEAGWKNRLLGGSLTLNADIFYYDYTDLQLSQIVGLTSVITNAAAARVKGVEVETVWRPEAHWTLSGNLSLLSAKFVSFVNIDSLAPALGPQNVSGHYLAGAPEVSANLGAAYRSDPILFGGRLTARADVSLRSKTYFREFNGPLDAQKPYTLVNASLIWDSPNETYRVRLYGQNLTDQDYITQMNASDNFGSRYVSWGAPRQIGVELKAKF